MCFVNSKFKISHSISYVQNVVKNMKVVSLSMNIPRMPASGCRCNDLPTNPSWRRPN